MSKRKGQVAQDRKMKWWREARFGLFIHWGLYAAPAGSWDGKEIPGIGEWIQSRAKIPVGRYERLAETFNPAKFDAKAWVKLAKDAGMKYLCITSKHHDGFAIYKSEASPYNIVDATPYKKDPVAALARECKKAGIKLCFYYSQKQDWHHPDGSGNTWDYNPDKQDFNRYMREKALPQVREILTQYGPIGMIWYDTPQNLSRAQTKRFVDQVYDVQPTCIVNGRAGHGIGDYRSMGDNAIPPGRVEGDWETPATLNDTWGFKTNDHNWKPAKGLIQRLVDIVGKGGNYLLNVGPTAEGMIPKPSVSRLLEVGKWMKVNGEAIYGAAAGPSPQELAWGSMTSKKGKLYLNVVDWPGKSLRIYGLKNRIKKATLLASPKLTVGVAQSTFDEVGLNVLDLTLPGRAPDKHVSVIRLDVVGTPEMDQSLVQQGDGRILLDAFHAGIKPPGRAVSGRFGAVEGWIGKSTSVSWDVHVAEPGTYDVVVVTQTDHDGRWDTGSRVKVSVGRQSTTGTLMKQATKTNLGSDSYRLDVESRLGRIEIKWPGSHKVTIRAEKIGKAKGLGIRLRGIQLIPR